MLSLQWTALVVFVCTYFAYCVKNSMTVDYMFNIQFLSYLQVLIKVVLVILAFLNIGRVPKNETGSIR